MIVDGLEKHFGKHNDEAFAESAESGQDMDFVKSIGYMVDGFVDNCGVSAGSVLWHLVGRGGLFPFPLTIFISEYCRLSKLCTTFAFAFRKSTDIARVH